MSKPKNEFGMHHEASPELFGFAKKMRRNPTEAEAVLWNELKSKKLDGFKFRRQHPVGEFIVDFYCHKAKLAIEIDGKSHDYGEQHKNDEIRTMRLEESGLSELRFKNEEVLNHLEYVLLIIRDNLKDLI